MYSSHSTGGFDWTAVALEWASAYLAVALYALALWGYLTTPVDPEIIVWAALTVAVMLVVFAFGLRWFTRGFRSAMWFFGPARIIEALVLPGVLFVPVALYAVVFWLFVGFVGLRVSAGISRFLARRLRSYREDLDDARGGPLPGRTTRNDIPTGGRVAVVSV
jgi:hypothetical protein